jgi:hypothetical protein
LVVEFLLERLLVLPSNPILNGLSHLSDWGYIFTSSWQLSTLIPCSCLFYLEPYFWIIIIQITVKIANRLLIVVLRLSGSTDSRLWACTLHFFEITYN